MIAIHARPLVGFVVVGAMIALAGLARADEPAARVSLRVPSPSDREPANLEANLEEEAVLRQRIVEFSTVRLMNFTSQPFNYQISRTSGSWWTHTYTIPPKMMHLFTADDLRQASTERTLNIFGKPGHVFIRFRVADGWQIFKVLTNSAYYYVVNANGYGDLVEPTTAAPVARISPGAEARMLELLGYNHGFSRPNPLYQVNPAGVPTRPTWQPYQ